MPLQPPHHLAAAPAAPSTSARRGALPVVEGAARAPGPDRRLDRRVASSGLTTSLVFLVTAAASLAMPPEARLGWWLPLHLALAGAASTALAAMVPFFVAALTVAPPAPAGLRAASVVLVALGAAIAAVARVVAPGANAVAAAGGAAFIVGLVLVLVATIVALAGATRSRRPVSSGAYLVALVDVSLGVAVAVAGLATGFGEAWPSLRAAHAWLNLLGFLPLAIAGTLVHFAPTVAGSRIRARRSGTTAVALLAVAGPLAAAGYAVGGYALGADARAGGFLVVLGCVGLVAGSAALARYAWGAHRDRVGWTTERDWHAFTSGSLLAAPAWLVVAAVVAAAAALPAGADPAGWRLVPLLAPLVAGFVVQVLLGSLTFLVPATTTASPERHAAMRHSLGRVAVPRVVAWNVGTALLAAGQGLGNATLAAAGGTVVATSLVATLALLGIALVLGRAAPRR